MEGFRIGSKVVHNLRYADDTVILAESEQQLQKLIDTLQYNRTERTISKQHKIRYYGIFGSKS